MKRTLIALTLMLTAGFISAAEGANPPLSKNTEVRQHISRSIGYPNGLSAKHSTEFVLVSFRVEACGTITILSSNTSNANFEAYVLRKLNALSLRKGEEETHHMRFTFRHQ